MWRAVHFGATSILPQQWGNSYWCWYWGCIWCFQSIFALFSFLCQEAEQMAGSHQSFTFEAFWVVSRYNSAACAEVHLRWPDLLNFVVLPSGKSHRWAFCPSFLGRMGSVSQAETAPGFAVCVGKSLWLSSDPALPKLPCKGPMSGIALSLHSEWFQVSGAVCVRCWSLLINLLALPGVRSSVGIWVNTWVGFPLSTWRWKIGYFWLSVPGSYIGGFSSRLSLHV